MKDRSQDPGGPGREDASRRDKPRQDRPRPDATRRDASRRGSPGRDFPRRDQDGRVAGLVDLLALTVAGLLTTATVLVLLDASGAALGWGTFGEISGWLVLILPAWLFLIEEMRAWRGVSGRLPAAAAGGLVALALGLLVASVVPGPPLVTGGAGGAVAALAYAVWWFHSIRWLARREGSLR